MKEAFDIVLAGLCLAGLAATGAALLVHLAWRTVARRVRGADGASGSRRVAFLAAPLAFAVVMVLYGGSKGFLPDGMRASDTSAVSEAAAASDMTPSSAVQSDGAALSAEAPSVLAVAPTAATETVSVVSPSPFAGEPSLVGKWWRRGAYDDGEIVEVPASSGWAFPWRGGRLTRFEVWANGAVYASEKDEEPIARLKTSLSLRPRFSRVVHGLTTNNAYRIEWRDAHPNRDPNAVADAAIELRPNGDIVLAEGGAETLLPYEIPFAHDGFGQDEEWVRANFPNADEILAIGYRAWVDAQVGEGERNGLYRFSASFPAAPPYAVELVVGGLSVCVTNAGEYVFLLEKGVEYSFSSEPFDAAVRWSADDGAAKSPRTAAATSATGQWTVAGGDLRLVSPTSAAPGCILWMPTLTVMPGVAHLGPGDPAPVFTAALSDCPDAVRASFAWDSSLGQSVFSSPSSAATRLDVKDFPSWSEFTATLTATVGTNELVSILYATYGTNATPQVRISMNVPEGLAVGGVRREMKVHLVSDCATNGTVIVRCVNGGDNVSLWSAETGGVRLGGSAQWDLNSETDGMFSLFAQGVDASEYEGVEFECRFLPEDGRVQSSCAKTTVFECHVQPIENDPRRGYEVVNPCYLSTNSDSVFRIAVKPEGIPTSKIRWKVVSGKATFLSARNGLETTVRGVSGMVDLEISVLGATDERMHFRAKVQ